MTESNSQPEKPKDERRYHPELLKKGLRCDLDQYAFLKECSEKGEEGIKKWNEWRKEHLGDAVLLEGSDLSALNLRGVNLGWGWPKNPRRHMYCLGNSGPVCLKGALLDRTDMEGAQFGLADLRDSNFMDAGLEGAHFEQSDLRGAYFMHATVDAATLFWKCPVTRYSKERTFTDFTGVPLHSIRIDPETEELLKYNIRRMNWEQWYIGDKAEKPFGKIETRKEKFVRIWRVKLRLALTIPIRLFWSMSDYGLRTWPIIAWFFGLAFAFALLYWLLPNTVMVKETGGDIQGLWHALYFSVVTMTTLDFGDIAANPDSWLGQALLMIQVILGYVLLGALVTRFAVLFTTGGPAGKFADEKTILERLKELWNKINKKR